MIKNFLNTLKYGIKNFIFIERLKIYLKLYLKKDLIVNLYTIMNT